MTAGKLLSAAELANIGERWDACRLAALDIWVYVSGDREHVVLDSPSDKPVTALHGAMVEAHADVPALLGHVEAQAHGLETQAATIRGMEAERDAIAAKMIDCQREIRRHDIAAEIERERLRAAGGEP